MKKKAYNVGFGSYPDQTQTPKDTCLLIRLGNSSNYIANISSE
jgi:hypothetical protein